MLDIPDYLRVRAVQEARDRTFGIFGSPLIVYAVEGTYAFGHGNLVRIHTRNLHLPKQIVVVLQEDEAYIFDRSRLRVTDHHGYDQLFWAANVYSIHV